eukprot:3986709-Heterocapsa_arctica.AAC.1
MRLRADAVMTLALLVHAMQERRIDVSAEEYCPFPPPFTVLTKVRHDRTDGISCGKFDEFRNVPHLRTVRVLKYPRHFAFVALTNDFQCRAKTSVANSET